MAQGRVTLEARRYAAVVCTARRHAGAAHRGTSDRGGAHRCWLIAFGGISRHPEPSAPGAVAVIGWMPISASVASAPAGTLIVSRPSLDARAPPAAPILAKVGSPLGFAGRGLCNRRRCGCGARCRRRPPGPVLESAGAGQPRARAPERRPQVRACCRRHHHRQPSARLPDIHDSARAVRRRLTIPFISAPLRAAHVAAVGSGVGAGRYAAVTRRVAARART